MYRLITAAALAGLLSASALGQATSFTYQGQLKDDGIPANGSYNLVFKLFNASSGGAQVGTTITRNGVMLTNGLFNQTLDFGAGAFTGQPRWLEITVSGVGLGRQPMTATPYALYALSGPWQTSGADIYSTNTGGVGIGLIDPIYDLDVVSDVGIRLGMQGNGGGALVLANNTGDNSIYLEGYNSNSDGSASAMLLTGFQGGTIPQLTLRADATNFEGNAYFGEQGRQMLNLFGTGYGIGIQTATLYSRSGGGFAWHVGGTHTDNFYDSGGGTTLMTLDGTRGLDFKSRLGQHLSLWGSDGPRRFGIGIQAQTLYSRTGGNAGDGFAWFKGGGHSDGVRNPGGGTTLMTLDQENGLAISTNVGIGTSTPAHKLHIAGEGATGFAIGIEGNATQNADKGGWVKAMAYVNGDGTLIRSYNPFATTTVTRTNTGSYKIQFGFQASHRFVSVTAEGGAENAGANYILVPGDGSIVVWTFNTDQRIVNRDCPFMIIVY